MIIRLITALFVVGPLLIAAVIGRGTR